MTGRPDGQSTHWTRLVLGAIGISLLLGIVLYVVYR
jgi:hypothetical protein